MRNKIGSIIAAVIIAAGALPLASLTPLAPADPADAGCVTYVENNVVQTDCSGDTGTKTGWKPVNGGGSGSGPYCTSGVPAWKWPRSSGYPNPVKTSSNSIIDEFDDHFDEEWARVADGYVNGIQGGNQSSFFWKTSLYDLGAMFMMINPQTGNLSTASSEAAQQALFNNTIQKSRSKTPGTLVTTTIKFPHDPEPYTTVNVSPEGATAVYAAGSPTAPIDYTFNSAGFLTSAKVIASINSKVGGNDFYWYMSMNGKNFNNAQGYVGTALGASWVTQNRLALGGSSASKWPVEIWAQSGGVGAYAKVTTANTFFPAGTNWYAIAIFPNRKPGLNSLAELRNAFFSAINVEMNRKWTATGKKYYEYPAFLAPSVNTAPSACGDNLVAITVGGQKFKFPQQHGWTSGSWNHCRTNNLSTTAIYRNQVASDTGACWMAWLKRPLDPPKLPSKSWNAAVNNKISPIFFGPSLATTQIGSAPAALTGRSASGVAKPAPTTGKNFSLSTPIGNTEFNLTMVGFTAELPGVCSDILIGNSGSTVTTPGGKACELVKVKAVPGQVPTIKLPAFARTALSRLQDDDCQAAVGTGGSGMAARLLNACGIVYSGGAWKYRVTFHTWWDGEYKISNIPYRGLFDSTYVIYPSSADAAKARLWDTAFSTRYPLGRPQNPWPQFYNSTSGSSSVYAPMYYYACDKSDSGDPGYPCAANLYAQDYNGALVPYLDLNVTQSQPVGG